MQYVFEYTVNYDRITYRYRRNDSAILMQGALGVGETYSLAALNGTVSSIGVGDVIGTFVLSGTLGAIGAKGGAATFKRAGQIEASFIKYATRDISRYGASIIEALGKYGGKYLNEFIIPTVKSALTTESILLGAGVSYYWGQSIFGR